MKKLIAVLICIWLFAGLCACGTAQKEATTTELAAEAESVTATALVTESTTEVPKIKPAVSYPASYKGAPKAYKPILDDLYKCYHLSLRDDLDQIDWDYVMGETHLNWSPPHHTLGYMVLDMNKDGISELLISAGEPGDEGFLWALFALKNNKPVHIDSNSWLDRCEWYFLADGTIYRVGDGGSFYTYVSSWRLKPNEEKLTRIEEYGRDCDMQYYYSIVNEKEEYITEEVFEAMHKKFSNPPNQMKFEFVPIEQ